MPNICLGLKEATMLSEKSRVFGAKFYHFYDKAEGSFQTLLTQFLCCVFLCVASSFRFIKLLQLAVSKAPCVRSKPSQKGELQNNLQHKRHHKTLRSPTYATSMFSIYRCESSCEPSGATTSCKSCRSPCGRTHEWWSSVSPNTSASVLASSPPPLTLLLSTTTLTCLPSVTSPSSSFRSVNPRAVEIKVHLK